MILFLAHTSFYDPTQYPTADQNRHSIIRTAAASAQSTPTYSIARPLSSIGANSGSHFNYNPSRNVLPTFEASSENVNRHSNFGILPERTIPVVGRPPKPLPKSSSVVESVVSHEARNESNGIEEDNQRVSFV